MSNNKFSFIHIPKTGGTSLLQSLRCSKIDIDYLLHSNLQSFHNRNIKNSVISCVRNPFDRVISFYYYFIQSEHPIPSLQHMTLESFIDNLEDIHPLIKPCYDFLTIDGEYKCDFLLKFETLEKDYKQMMQKIGIMVPCDLIHLKNNTTKPLFDRNNVYNSEQIEKISRIYEKDMNFFGYSYENWIN